MNQNIFLMPLVFSFFVSAALIVFFILISRKKIFKDFRKGDRHIHKNGISRFGGVAIILAFVLSISLNQDLILEKPLLSVLLISIGILFFGLFDDFFEINWKWQLLFQILIVMLVFIVGIRLQYITNPFGGIFLFNNLWANIIGFLLASIWMIFLINAMNWLDGIDGVSAGVTFIALATIFFLSQRPQVDQPPIGIIAAILLGSFLAFLIFNFNPAKIMAGTSGSMFMGFILAILAIFAGAKIATTVLVLAIPVIDASWVIFERLGANISIFSADRRHLHYRLMELGYTQAAICNLYWTITAVIAIISLNTNAIGKMWLFGLIVVIMVSLLFYIKNKVTNKNAQ